MDARVVWQTWRKILRDESLQKVLFERNWDPQSCVDLSLDEKRVISAYSNDVDRAKWFIENYQFRLTNSFINALETGAPLTLRALLNRGLDLKRMSQHFLRSKKWHDYGPRVYSYCEAVLAWLKDNAHEWELPDPLVDLVQLESEVVALYLSINQGKQDRPSNGAYSCTGMARVYVSKYRLSNWLRTKKLVGVLELDLSEEYFLVALPNLTSRHRFLLVPQRCAQLYYSPPKLGDHISESDLTHLNRLVSANALRMVEGEVEVR